MIKQKANNIYDRQIKMCTCDLEQMMKFKWVYKGVEKQRTKLDLGVYLK